MYCTVFLYVFVLRVVSRLSRDDFFDDEFAAFDDFAFLRAAVGASFFIAGYCERFVAGMAKRHALDYVHFEFGVFEHSAFDDCGVAGFEIFGNDTRIFAYVEHERFNFGDVVFLCHLFDFVDYLGN